MTEITEDVTTFELYEEVITLFYVIDQIYIIAAWTNAWKCSNKEKNIAKHLVENVERWQQAGVSNWLIYQLDEAVYPMFIHLVSDLYNHPLNLKDLKNQRNALPIQAREELCIDGK